MASSQDDKQAWSEFVTWCGSRGLAAVPANPWTLAAYARALETKFKAPRVRKTIDAVAAVHQEKSKRRPDRHPIVIKTLLFIETNAKAKDIGPDQAPVLFEEADFFDPANPSKSVPKKKTVHKKTVSTNGRIKKSLSSQPRLVTRRRLKS